MINPAIDRFNIIWFFVQKKVKNSHSLFAIKDMIQPFQADSMIIIISMSDAHGYLN